MANSAAEEIRPRKRLRTKTCLRKDALACESGRFTITARLPSGAELATVQIIPTATVADLQASLVQAATLPGMYALQLIWHGSLLKPHQTLIDSDLHDGSVMEAIRRDGFVAVGMSSWNDSGSVHLLNVMSGQVHKTWKCKHRGHALAFPKHDCILVAGCRYGCGMISSCSISTGECRAIVDLELNYEMHCIAFTSDCSHVVAAGHTGKLCLWDFGKINEQMQGADVPKTVRKISDKTWKISRQSEVMQIQCSPKGRILAARPDQIPEGIAICDYESGKLLRRLRSRRNTDDFVVESTFSPDGSCLAFLIKDDQHAEDDNDIYWVELWQVDGLAPFKVFGERRFVWFPGVTESRSLLFSPDGEKLVVSLLEYHPRARHKSACVYYVWDVSSGSCEQTLRWEAGAGGERFCAYSPDGSLLAVITSKLIRVWCTSTWDEVCNAKLPCGTVSCGTSIEDLRFMPRF